MVASTPHAHAFTIVAHTHLSALTASYFLPGQKVGKKTLLPHPAPALRSGVPSLRRLAGPARPQFASQVVQLASSGYAIGGATHPGPSRRLRSAS